MLKNISKSTKTQKNDVQKTIKNQNDLKEPPRADLEGFGVPRDLKKHQKMTPKWPSGVKRLIFGKVHISSALPMREELRALEKTWKIIQILANVKEKTEVRKRRPSETHFWCFGAHFGASWGPRREPKMQKRGFGRVPKKGLKNECRESPQTNCKGAKKDHPSINTSD